MTENHLNESEKRNLQFAQEKAQQFRGIASPATVKELQRTAEVLNSFKIPQLNGIIALQEQMRALTAPAREMQEKLNFFTKGITDINRAFSEHLKAIVPDMARFKIEIAQPFSEIIHNFHRSFEPYKGLFKEVFVELNQQKSFCDECNSKGWVPHPVLYRFFGEKFSSLPEKEQENCIKERWGEFRELLWDRRPQKLMHNGREERLRQIINAQGAEGYIAVCRSVHPEIESLAREYVYRDENFISSLKEAASKSRAKEINTRVNKLFDEDASPLGGAYIIEMGGIMASRRTRRFF
jgi:hypothetical protein